MHPPKTLSNMSGSESIQLARYVLPEELFEYFDLEKIEEIDKELHFYLYEHNLPPASYPQGSLSSKGFHAEVVIKDFPVRDKPLFLHIHRRRWLDKSNGSSVSRDWHVVAQGTHYTQGFASFLKELVGYLPDRFP